MPYTISFCFSVVVWDQFWFPIENADPIGRRGFWRLKCQLTIVCYNSLVCFQVLSTTKKKKAFWLLFFAPTPCLFQWATLSIGFIWGDLIITHLILQLFLSNWLDFTSSGTTTFNFNWILYLDLDLDLVP